MVLVPEVGFSEEGPSSVWKDAKGLGRLGALVLLLGDNIHYLLAPTHSLDETNGSMLAGL